MDEYNFLAELSSNIGQTVTIYTTSGGDSGRGFTGVLTMVNPSFVRLVTNLGPAPGCALGSCCDKNHRVEQSKEGNNLGVQGRPDCRPGDLGSIVDIPVDRIAAFVHNSVGSN
ncbi:hypothetical protein M2651_06495 [Clostridium sp. SYSU_GA19001]|uniref:hypothetical protein n=1 Tax=Clostridium caldaquaticum TaxID=2940653 RepID=UPI002076FE3B|nr:hypothetical protein [Clostridium caldaquaticum]MCM8710675.1 hypothetical protein [Clostridium caldaquaticum]